MHKDENPPDLDACFSDIWTAAQRSRSHFLQLFAVNTWRMIVPVELRRKMRKRNRISRGHGLPSQLRN
jgi:hypothetical protein